MPFITRRDLLLSGVVLSASSLAARSAFARTAALLAAESAGDPAVAAIPAVGPREQLLFDFGWKFTFGHGCDPSKDLGFGYGQGDLPRPANSSLPRPDSTIPSGARSICRTTGRSSCPSSTTTAQTTLIARLQAPRPPLSGDQRGLVPPRVRDSRQRPGPPHLRSSSTAPFATCWSSSTAASSAATTTATRPSAST